MPCCRLNRRVLPSRRRDPTEARARVALSGILAYGPARMLPARLSPSHLVRHAVALATSLALAVTSAVPVSAQGGRGGPQEQGRIAIVRDTEIEGLLRDYVRPILRAARIGADRNVDVVLVNDRSFNAFVIDGRRIFITIGALLDSQTPNEVIGVLAHETGHIAGGHLARLRQELQNAQTSSILAILLGALAIAGAAAAGARAGDLGQAAIGVATGAGGIGMRTLLAYQRTEENAADRAAIGYLAASGQSARGMLRTFERLADQMQGLTRIVDPYAVSHPMPRERIANLRELVEASPHREARDPPALQARHDMMRAKISGYLERPDAVLRRYPASDTSLPARYARAIAQTRMGSFDSAMREFDGLIRAQPSNPYFHETKAQALAERGYMRQAIPHYRRAVQLSNGAPLIRIGLGRALVGSEDRSLLEEAIRELERGLIAEREAGLGYRFLAIAYSRRGDEGRASLATAQGYFVEGNFRYAREAAARAQSMLPRGSPGWVRAEDILTYRPPRGEN
jgi:predicted Zn-dependent protease